MHIGVSGHRRRTDADWEWTRDEITNIFIEHSKAIGWSSLAVGADQIFAEVALAYGRGFIAVLPSEDYAAEFDDAISLKAYDALLRQARRIVKVRAKTKGQGFREAGEHIVRSVQLMILVWDGEPAKGEGGTGDMAAYAVARGVPTIWLNPIARTRIDGPPAPHKADRP